MPGNVPIPYWIVLAVLWEAAALHTALGMRANGRRWWVWLIVSTFLSVLPATIVSYADYFRRLRQWRSAQGGRDGPRGGAARCPRCGTMLAGREVPRAGGHDLCPNCRLPLHDEPVA